MAVLHAHFFDLCLWQDVCGFGCLGGFVLFFGGGLFAVFRGGGMFGCIHTHALLTFREGS